jgi:opacity protein-like surface antigen
LWPAAAHAQNERLSLSFTPGIATLSGDSELALAGSAAYCFSQHFSFEGDVTWIDAAAGGFRDRRFEVDGRGFTGGLTTLVQRVGGMFGGNNRFRGFAGRNIGTLPNIPGNAAQLVASIDGQTWIGTMGLRYEPTVQTARFQPYASGGLGFNYTDETFSLGSTAFSQAYEGSVSHTGIAFSAGGGASIRLFDPLWVTADAKYFGLSRDRNMVRFGGGVTFKF